ncbi:hypothetical protein VTO42DRAFT_1635 [Malbranchea cinnamomea]
MFYEGDLQSGIALAIREAKQVICFVGDDGAESKTWVNEYLADTQVSRLVANAVALRLTAGSQEAGFLSSFCPISKVPTLVVINNGTLQEYIVSGTSGDEVKQRLKVALGGGGANGAATTGQQGGRQEDQQPPPLAEPIPSAASEPTAHTAPQLPSSFTPEQESAGVAENVAEIQRRQHIREGKRRADSVEEAQQLNDASKTTQQDWQQQRRKREQKEKQEKERILSLIRHDREERKAREERRKMSHLPRDTIAHVSDTPARSPSTPKSQLRIQVRLFDGSSIRSSFSPSQTIRSDVRPWIDRERTDGDAPYTLKLILTPLPNKTISVAEEDEKLGDLELGPTASFVMVPVRTYAEAYSSTASLPVRGLYAGYNFITGTIGAIAGALGTFLGFGQSQSSGASSSTSNNHASQATTSGNTQRRNDTFRKSTIHSNVWTIHDHLSDDRTQQFYNGNQLNFEPRKEDIDD